MDESKGQKVTIEQLAKMVGDGFAEVTKQAESNFHAVDAQLFDITGRLGHVESRLGRIEHELSIGNYERRLESLEEDVDRLKPHPTGR
jgi:predicted  nucleic acid-binding Zn-ribbon protein